MKNSNKVFKCNDGIYYIIGIGGRMEETEIYKSYVGKKVKLLIKDPVMPNPNKKEGVFKGYDETHYHLVTDLGQTISVLRITVLRLEEIK